jgi:hypothetical protein
VRNSTTKQIQYRNFATTGDVDGPVSSTDNALVRFDGVTGKLIQDSNATLDDFGNAIFVGDVTVGSDLITDFVTEKTLNHGVWVGGNIYLDGANRQIDTTGAQPISIGLTNATLINIDDLVVTGEQLDTQAASQLELGVTTASSVRIQDLIYTAEAIDGTGSSNIEIGVSAASSVRVMDFLFEANTLDTAIATSMNIGGANATEIFLRDRTLVGTGSFFNASVAFQVNSTTQGVLGPRMTSAQRTAIASPAAGLEVYDTTVNQKYLYNGSAWVILG